MDVNKTSFQNVDEAALTQNGLEAAFRLAQKNGEAITPKDVDTRGDATPLVVGSQKYVVNFSATGAQLNAIRPKLEDLGIKFTSVSL